MTDNTNIRTLLPCAHCGGKAMVKRNKTVLVQCTVCSATTFQILSDPESAIVVWNRRAALSNAEPVGEIMQVDEIVFCELHHPENMTIGDPVFLHPIVSAPLTIDRIVEIANERHRAMPDGADDHDEMIAIVKDVLAAVGITLHGESG